MEKTDQQWWTDHTALVEFGRVLDAADWFDKPDDVLYYVEKPWKYDDVRQRWQAAGKPGPEDSDAMLLLSEDSDAGGAEQ